MKTLLLQTISKDEHIVEIETTIESRSKIGAIAYASNERKTFKTPTEALEYARTLFGEVCEVDKDCRLISLGTMRFEIPGHVIFTNCVFDPPLA